MLLVWVTLFDAVGLGNADCPLPANLSNLRKGVFKPFSVSFRGPTLTGQDVTLSGGAWHGISLI